jgi:hypothetical protein
MLTQVSVVPPTGAFWDPVTIPLLAPNSDGIFLEKVDGLEPVQAEITTNSYHELDGEFYVGSRVGKRNIVLHMILEPGRDLTVSDLRRKLYGYFMPKLPVTLQFDFTDRESVQIDGYVEDYQGDRFSQDPDAAISIICPKPNFKSVTQYSVSDNSEVGTDPPLTDVLNDGDREIGFELWITNDSGVDFSGDIKIDRLVESSPGVYYSSQELYLESVDLPGALVDYVYINTRRGEKVIQLHNSSTSPETVDSILGKMTDDSDWPSLYSAMNKFRVVTTGTTGWGTNHLNWTLKFYYEFGAL